jgi:hypothetical protein
MTKPFSQLRLTGGDVGGEHDCGPVVDAAHGPQRFGAHAPLDPTGGAHGDIPGLAT